MKDSAGVKFNENTELIIEADPTGEVTSCRNVINGVEYVGGGGGDFSTAEVTINNLDEEIAFPIASVIDDDGYLTIGKTIFPGENEVNILYGVEPTELHIDTTADEYPNVHFANATGDIEIDGDKTALINGNGTIDIVNS